jgi:hypothetical protein
VLCSGHGRGWRLERNITRKSCKREIVPDLSRSPALYSLTIAKHSACDDSMTFALVCVNRFAGHLWAFDFHGQVFTTFRQPLTIYVRVRYNKPTLKPLEVHSHPCKSFIYADTATAGAFLPASPTRSPPKSNPHRLANPSQTS